MEEFNRLFKNIVETYGNNTQYILDSINLNEVEKTYEEFIEICKYYKFNITINPQQFTDIFLENNNFCTIRNKDQIYRMSDEYYDAFKDKKEVNIKKEILEEYFGNLRRNAANFTETSSFADFKDRTFLDIKNIIYKKYPNIDLNRGFDDFIFEVKKLIDNHVIRYQDKGEDELRDSINSICNILDEKLIETR